MHEHGATHVSASELLQEFPKVGIPHFQRGLVWNDDATSLLLESLYFQTPCGNIILWMPMKPEEHGEPLLEGADCEYLVVDGQQRMRMLHGAFAASGDRQWHIDLTVEPQISPLIGTDPRQRLFTFVATSVAARHPRDKHNLVPLSAFFSPAAQSTILRQQHIVAPSHIAPHQIETALEGVQSRVREMQYHRLFGRVILKEEDGRYGIGDVVSLYNRINSAGRRVEAEEMAYATLVRLYPETTACLRRFFDLVRNVADAERDTLLKREKENRFGFKLYLRTFAQVCNYHFQRSSGTQGFSYDVIHSTQLQHWFDGHRESAGLLFERTTQVLAQVRKVLATELHCDDLRMLPDTDCLIPALQLLIRYYPATLSQDYARQIAALILRITLEPDRNQRQTLRLLRVIDRSHNVKECLESLAKDDCTAWTEQKTARLKEQLENGNTLSDRQALLLYWLIRRNGAKDFSYVNLNDTQPLRHRAGMEPLVSEITKPEKQHMAPASILGREIFGAAGRITTSRHAANNVGNLTYISRDLNHFITGLGDRWMDPGKEHGDNLAAHLLTGQALTAYECLRKTDRNLSPRDEAMFLNFCEERRALIQSALLTWLRELWEDFATCGERVEPEKRLANPDTADHIRDLDYPPQIEDAFLRISMCPRVSGSPVSRKNGAALAFTVREKKGAKAFQMVAVAVPPQIEIEDRVGRERLDLLRDILVKNGVARMPDNPQRWVLHCEPEHEQTTARILDLFVSQLI